MLFLMLTPHLSGGVQAQETVRKATESVVYRGSVIDDEGAPLPGASVAVKGLKGVGVTTDNAGEFTIKLPQGKYGSYNIVVFLTICISYANNCFTL